MIDKMVATCAAIRDRSLTAFLRTAGDALRETSLRQVKPECFADPRGDQQ
jgi:hypothetical protein